MYNAFYNLRTDPFRLTPDPAFLYMTAQHREALAGLVHSACNRSGLTVLAGEAGTGKTMLLHVLRTWLEKRHFRIALCTNPTMTREELYDLILLQLGITCPSPLKSRQLLALEQSLLHSKAERRRSIIIVDEAHALPPALLEEVRLLLNLETSQEKLLDIIIAGQPELMDALRRPELRQLKQRVTCFCRLEPMTYAEVSEYIAHRLAQAGVPNQNIFTEDTIRLVYDYSHGIPRLVNTICDSALRSGFALESRQITDDIVHEVAVDLDLRGISANELPFEKEDGDWSLYDRGSRTSMTPKPAEDYTTRQKSIGVLATLVDRLR